MNVVDAEERHETNADALSFWVGDVVGVEDLRAIDVAGEDLRAKNAVDGEDLDAGSIVQFLWSVVTERTNRR